MMDVENGILLWISHIHPLKTYFCLMALSIIVLGGLINTIEGKIPIFIIQTFRYGKFAYKGKQSFLKPVEVPKRWFKHFYLFAICFSVLCLIITLKVYLFGGGAPTFLINLLDFVATKDRTYTTAPICSLLAMVFITAQSARRFYETWFVSVFSEGRINLAHYLVGYLHYFGTVCAILAESPGFTAHIGVSPLVLKLNFFELQYYNILGIMAFFWASVHQFRAAVIFANLRKDSSGKVVKLDHSIPAGDWFNFVSSPHMLAEILIYLSLTCLIWRNTIFPYVTLWVVTNQIENALLSHWWYQSKYKEYPKCRRAVIPFLL